MCFAPKVSVPAATVAQTDNSEAIRQATLEASIRRRRAGAAANILTGSTGIPSTTTLGGVAS